MGGRLYARARTAAGYRMFTVPGPFPRPGLVHTGDGPADGIEVEVWDVPLESLGRLVERIAEPLHLGPLTLNDGQTVPGFLADRTCAITTADITSAGGWRAHLAVR